MKLSIADISLVRTRETAADAFAPMVNLAWVPEQLGYSHYWVAKLHGLADSIASTTTASNLT